MNDFLYKKIQFEHVDVITQQLLEIAREFNPTKTRTVNFPVDLLQTRVPLLLDQFNNMNVTCEIFREFVSPPYAGLGIHLDGSPESPKHLALNWPIEYCENTYMKWWDFNEEMKVSVETKDPLYNTSLIIYSKENAIEVGSLEILEPVLVNIGKYHSVDNNKDTIRRMISFRFTEEPDSLI